MEFEVYIKEKDIYKKYILTPPANSGWQYLKSLKLTVLKQLDIIRDDILYYLDEEKKINLSKPKSKDVEKQEKVNILIEMRKVNTNTKNIICSLLFNEDFIFCSNCGHKMQKTPINVSYDKYGSKFVLKNVNLHEVIKYVYMCEYCWLAISEENYNEKMHNLNLREELLSKGETFIPNEFGFWHYIQK